MAEEDEVVLYSNEDSHYSRKVLIGLYEKRVKFRTHHLNLKEGDQLERWFLEINPKGQVPVLKHGDRVITDSTEILEYVDKTFGAKFLLFPMENGTRMRELLSLIDSVNVFTLTYGVVCFHALGLTEKLRHPYSTPGFQELMRQLILTRPLYLQMVAEKNADIPAGKVLEEKARSLKPVLEMFQDRAKFLLFLASVEKVLDELEGELGKDDRVGPWLCGPKFSAVDIALTSLLVRLYQLGLDEEYWRGARRPHLAIYQELAFRRPSVQKVTFLKANEDKFVLVKNLMGSSQSAAAREEEGAQALDAAKVGLGALLVLGGVYAARKLWKK